MSEIGFRFKGDVEVGPLRFRFRNFEGSFHERKPYASQDDRSFEGHQFRLDLGDD
jgi:hypothetical protein